MNADDHAKAHPWTWFEVGDQTRKAEAQARIDAGDYPPDDEHSVPAIDVAHYPLSKWWRD